MVNYKVYVWCFSFNNMIHNTQHDTTCMYIVDLQIFLTCNYYSCIYIYICLQWRNCSKEAWWSYTYRIKLWKTITNLVKLLRGLLDIVNDCFSINKYLNLTLDRKAIHKVQWRNWKLEKKNTYKIYKISDENNIPKHKNILLILN